MELKIFHTTTRKEYTYEVEDINNSRSFYHLRFELGDIEEGEYEYVLFEDGKEVVNGLLRYGDYKIKETKSYVPNDTKIVQYMG